jgi:GT2 family glycosyltransferase
LREIGDTLPTVTIVIVNLNGKKWLKNLLESIIATDYPKNRFDIIFVDNASTDGSVEIVKSICQDRVNLSIIKNSKNLGWSPANNQGMKIAKGEIITCVSNDMEVDPNWIKEIVSQMTSDNAVGIVQCNSLSMRDRKTIDSGMNYLDKFGFAYSYAPIDKNLEVFYAEGMAFAVKREVIQKIGMLDEYFFMEYDDMDFSWRARLIGYKVFFLPLAKVYHARGGTVGSTYFQRINNSKWYTRNHIITIIKNYELSTIFEVLPIVFSVEITKIMYLLIVKKNRMLSIAASKGLLDVLKDMRVIIKKRMEIQSMRKIPDKVIMKSMYPFNPWALRMFLSLQAKGKRLAIDTKTLSEVK